MPLLDVSFGIFAFLPQGWLFMIFVILIECLVMSRWLTPKWINLPIYQVTALMNIISGLVGMAISMLLNGGWFLVVWFPWVSNNEIDLSKKGALQALISYYIMAFLLTLIIEIFLSLRFLRKQYPKREIIKATLAANILSYLIGTLVLYSYSFH